MFVIYLVLQLFRCDAITTNVYLSTVCLLICLTVLYTVGQKCKPPLIYQ